MQQRSTVLSINVSIAVTSDYIDTSVEDKLYPLLWRRFPWLRGGVGECIGC